MNLQIDIQQDTGQQDSFGEPIPGLTNVTGLTSLWASMFTAGSREVYVAQKVIAETTAVFKLRYIDGVTEKMFVKYGGRTFQILGKPNNKDEKFEWLLISCKEVS